MNSRRTVIIAAALALAALAFFGNIYYLNSVKEKAYGEAKLVEVYVVKKAIPKGLTGAAARSQGYIETGKLPSEYRPGTAILEQNISDIDNRVAINALAPGQILVDGQFVDAAVANIGFSQKIPGGQVALTVSVDQVHGVAGLMVPGDKVDIMVTTRDQGNVNIRTLYQNANILAIGQKAAPTAGESATNTPAAAGGATAESGLITFAVPLEAAERIAFVSGESGIHNIYLALVPPDATPVPNPPVIDKNNVFSTPTGATPYAQP